MKRWKKFATPIVFTLIFVAGLIPGLGMLMSNPGIAYTPDSAEYLAGAGDIASHGLAVLFNPPVHPEFTPGVLWFVRPPVYPALLALIKSLPLLSTEAWNFVILWAMTVLGVLALHLFLKRNGGGAWVPVIVLPIISLAWATSIMSDNTFLLANALFLVAFLWFTERPGWLRALLVITLGILASFTKPVGAFTCILVGLAGLMDRKARWLSLAITGALVAVVALWSCRNNALYGRFLPSQVADTNMAFFNYPALLARENGANEWGIRDSMMRDFGQEVSDRGIASDDRAKTALLAEKAREATRYIMRKPLDYALCHLGYLPRVFGSMNLPIMRGKGPRPVERPPGHRGPAHGPPGGVSPAGAVNVAARAACFLLAILGVGFWWRRKKAQAIALVVGTLWLVMSMGPAGDDRTSLPALVFASVLAQGGWLTLRDWAGRAFKQGQG